jgi:hypothetical protein
MDKERKFYVKEAEENEAVLQKLKDAGKDESEWKQAVIVNLLRFTNSFIISISRTFILIKHTHIYIYVE